MQVSLSVWSPSNLSLLLDRSCSSHLSLCSYFELSTCFDFHNDRIPAVVPVPSVSSKRGPGSAPMHGLFTGDF